MYNKAQESQQSFLALSHLQPAAGLDGVKRIAVNTTCVF